MYATALKEYGKKIAAETTISVRREVLIKQMQIKFGLSASERDLILSTKGPIKLRNALRKTVTVQTKKEVLKNLD